MTDLAQTVARLAAILGPADGEPAPLGGPGGRTYRATFGGSQYVIRLPVANSDVLGIHRGAEWAASCAAARAGVGPPARASLDDPPVVVTSFLDGRSVTPEDFRRPELVWSVAGALRRMHGSGEQLASSFSPFGIVDVYHQVAVDRGAKVPAGYGPARKRARGIEKALRGSEHEPVPCHNDLVGANLLADGPSLRVLGWEYAGMGNRYFDLGNLAVNNGLDEAAEATLLEAYFGEPPDARRLACLRLMRFMSDFRESMWGVVQSAVSELDTDFGAYAAEHFARLEQTGGHADFGRWLKEARGNRS